MSDGINYIDVENRVLLIRGQQVLLDRDVAELYAVETRRVNEAVRRNVDKFPKGYIINLASEEWDSLRSQIATLETNGKGQYTKYKPSAFTEKGLYMLATILKSPNATQTTIAIVETFTKIRELSRVVAKLPVNQDENEQISLMKKSGMILAEVLDDNMLEVIGDETTFKLDLAILKVERKVKREKRK